MKKYVVTVLINPNFSIEEKKITKEVHHKSNIFPWYKVAQEEVSRKVKGATAAAMYLESKGIEIFRKDSKVKGKSLLHAVYIEATEKTLDNSCKVAKTIGKTFVHEVIRKQNVEKSHKKPSNNTPEAKAAAQILRKTKNWAKVHKNDGKEWKDRCKHCRRYHHRKAA